MYRRQGSRPSPWKRNAKKQKWLSGEALQIAVKRREVKSKGEKNRYKHLNAEFQRIARIRPHDIVKYNFEIVNVDGETHLALYAAPTGESDAKIDGAIIPLGESHKLRIEYYDGVRVALFYLDSNLVGSCDLLCQDAKKYDVGNVHCLGACAVVSTAAAESNVTVELTACNVYINSGESITERI